MDEEVRYGSFILNLKSRVFDSCKNLDEVNFSTLLECLDCANSDFQLLDSNEEVLIDYIYQTNSPNTKITRFIITFYDRVNSKNIISYLRNPNSDYRLVREKDNVILHYPKEEEQTVISSYQKKKRKNIV